MIHNRHVPGKGPLHATLLFVGEAPGKTECKYGEPFVGMTGQKVRGFIHKAGLHPDDVRWNNAVPELVAIPKDAGGKQRLLDKFHQHLEDDLIQMSPKVIVACGAVALLRLLGKTNITMNHGSVIPWKDTLVIPCLHPAGVMRSALQAEMLSIERVIARAVGYAQGWITYTSPEPELIINPPVYELETYLQRAKVLVVDTEFDPNKRTTHIIGLTTDHLGTEKRVISLTKEGLSIGHLDTLRKHFMRRDLMKVAHYHQADVEALSWLGIDTCVPWHCTLAASSTLYPDLPCGLSHVARFYLDNVDDWKAEKDFTSLVYNGKDVLFTWGVYLNQRVELAEAGMYELFETEVMLTLPRLWAMQTQGLKTCKDSIKEVLKAGTKELNELQGKICNQVDAVFTKRKEPLEKIIHNSTEEIKNIESSWQGEIDTNPTLGCCLEHKKYNGMRAKKFNNKTEKCTCKKLNNEFLTRGLRDKITSLRKEITNSKNKIKRWEKGFDPNNNDHLRWLLYDKAGLGLPPQKDRETKRATANATAIAKLISLKGTQKKVGVVELLQDIKRYQRVGHMMSTFYDPPTDKNGVVHPPYRMHGTGTGRPAGGDDEQLHDKGSGGLKFNVLNIPDEARGIYVPFSEG